MFEKFIQEPHSFYIHDAYSTRIGWQICFFFAT